MASKKTEAVTEIEGLIAKLKQEITPLQKRVLELEQAIKKHRTQQGRKVNWENDRELYGYVGLAYPLKSVPPWQQFMSKAAAFRATLDLLDESTEGVDILPVQYPLEPLPASVASTLNPYESIGTAQPSVDSQNESPPPLNETREQFLERMRNKINRKKQEIGCRECGHALHEGRLCGYTGSGQRGMCDCNDIRLGPTHEQMMMRDQ
jgi:hypothetical protein